MSNTTGEAVLQLVLTHQWYDMIESGKKKEEYRRLDSKRWGKTFGQGNKILISGCLHDPKDVIIRFYRAYAKNRKHMDIQCKGLKIAYGKAEWGANEGKEYYVLSLGDIINY